MITLVNYSLVLCCFIYLVVSFGYIWTGKPEWSVVYFAYAVANAGLLWSALKA